MDPDSPGVVAGLDRATADPKREEIVAENARVGRTGKRANLAKCGRPSKLERGPDASTHPELDAATQGRAADSALILTRREAIPKDQECQPRALVIGRGVRECA